MSGFENEEPRVAAAAPPILTRTGGRAAGAIRDQSYYVRYETVRGLRMTRVPPRGPFVFEVQPFRQIATDPLADGFHVERAGEIVSAALALQLEAMGYVVSLELAEALADLKEELGDRFRVDVERFALVASFAGDVRFTVRHTREEGRYATTAGIDVAVTVTTRRGGRSKVGYQHRIQETESAVGDTLGGASHRARTAAAGAVRRFVRTLLGDPRLEQALVDALAASPR